MSDEPIDVVLYEERDDIAIITLSRPHKKNPLTDAMIQGVADGIDAATKSRDVAAIVLRGSDGGSGDGGGKGASTASIETTGGATVSTVTPTA